MTQRMHDIPISFVIIDNKLYAAYLRSSLHTIMMRF
jgi:hypothetical protein